MLYLFICLFIHIQYITVYIFQQKCRVQEKTCRYVCRSVPVYNSIRKELSKKIEQVRTPIGSLGSTSIAILPTPPTVEPWW